LRRIQSHFGGTAVFVGGGDDTSLSQSAISELTGPSLNLTGRTSLPQLAAVLARADLMLANDTGPLHLAVALGRPVVAPYTCTKVRLTGPYGEGTHGIESRIWCQGSYLRRCGRLECMAELTADRLWPAVEGVLNRWHSSSRSA
jgi:ADP-heptose:LPS heptosyltransferase